MIIDGIKLEKIQTDDRHFCEECTYYKAYDWRGLCNAQKVKVPSTLNRCDTFELKKAKYVKTTNYITDDFWK